MRRRDFMGGVLATGVAAAQDKKARQAKVTKLFKSPDGHPNAMEATAEGMWVGDQVTERAHLLDWKTGDCSSGLTDWQDRQVAPVAMGWRLSRVGMVGGVADALELGDEYQGGRRGESER